MTKLLCTINRSGSGYAVKCPGIDAVPVTLSLTGAAARRAASARKAKPAKARKAAPKKAKAKPAAKPTAFRPGKPIKKKISLKKRTPAPTPTKRAAAPKREKASSKPAPLPGPRTHHDDDVRRAPFPIIDYCDENPDAKGCK